MKQQRMSTLAVSLVLLATSGLLGQLRRISLDDPELFDVWLFGFDAKADLTEYCGVQGDFFAVRRLAISTGAFSRSSIP